MTKTNLPVAVIGAGPVGLAAAAHLVEKGETPLVFEMADQVAGNMRSWEHVRVFSRWAENIDAAARRLLEGHGWIAPADEELPTGREIVELYLEPLAKLPQISPHLHFGTKVQAIGRKHLDKVKAAGRDDAPFVLQTVSSEGEMRFEAKAVIDASGTWANPNPIGAGGLPAQGEAAARARIFYGIPDVLGRDRRRYAGLTVMVVGSGHSAFQALLDLGRLRADFPETNVYWSLRSAPDETLFGGGDADELPARGALGMRLKELMEQGGLTVLAPNRIEAVSQVQRRLVVASDSGEAVEVDEIIAVTGSRPDLEMLRELRLNIDPALEGSAEIAPLIDPNFHSCGSVPPHGEAELRHPERGFYLVGNKSYGRAPTFLMMTGYEQVRSVVAAIAGDMESAARVDLVLPETGVCSAPDTAIYGLEDTNREGSAGCCAPVASAPVVLLGTD